MRSYSSWAATLGGLALVVPLVVHSTPAFAQVPDDQAIQLQLFEPAVGPQRFLTVSGANVLPNKQFQLGLAFTYMTGGLVVYNVDSHDNLTHRTDVVEDILGAQLGGAYGFGDQFQIGLIVPITLSMTGKGLDASTGNGLMDGLSVTGFGDASIEFGWRFYRENGLSLAAVPQITVPTSMSIAASDGVQKGAFLGDDLPGFKPRAAMEDCPSQ